HLTKNLKLRLTNDIPHRHDIDECRLYLHSSWTPAGKARAEDPSGRFLAEAVPAASECFLTQSTPYKNSRKRREALIVGCVSLLMLQRSLAKFDKKELKTRN
ncbi:hypothetical protein P4641_04205, partial [Halalkalibacterium halodurans]|uniref:hypothetical protein n=1 Tax=Halalkalibacterium halodurans TaxID=86665 RepID=UPI002E23506F|nr:hypothetical protein [Halalkalibacterium halodurans]